jgi:hypothetical protein
MQSVLFRDDNGMLISKIYKTTWEARDDNGHLQFLCSKKLPEHLEPKKEVKNGR